LIYMFLFYLARSLTLLAQLVRNYWIELN